MNDLRSPTVSRAALFERCGEPLKLKNVPVPIPDPGEVLVRVLCCTICGSDLHTFSGRRQSPCPSVLGHEMVGEVLNAGDTELVDHNKCPINVGDRITWSVAASCGCCDRCHDGMPQKCRTLLKYGHELFDGKTKLSGGLAEHCLLLPGTTIVRVPDALADEIVCPASCATATSFAAVRQAGELTGRRVLVMGAGLLGLTTCAIASSQGASEVCLCDVDTARLAKGTEFGVTRSVTEVAGEFDRIFEMSGHPDAVQTAFAATAVGARVVLVGSVSPGPAVTIDPEQIVRRLVTVCGVHNYIPEDLAAAVRFLATEADSFPFSSLVERTFSLDEVNEAFAYARENQPVRVAVRPRPKSDSNSY